MFLVPPICIFILLAGGLATAKAVSHSWPAVLLRLWPLLLHAFVFSRSSLLQRRPLQGRLLLPLHAFTSVLRVLEEKHGCTAAAAAAAAAVLDATSLGLPACALWDWPFSVSPVDDECRKTFYAAAAAAAAAPDARAARV